MVVNVRIIVFYRDYCTETSYLTTFFAENKLNYKK